MKATKAAKGRKAAKKHNTGAKRNATTTSKAANKRSRTWEAKNKGAKPWRPCAKLHKCEHCVKAFDTATDLKRHTKTVHEKEKDCVCPHCAKAFGEKGNLNVHIRNVHDKIRAFKCEHCNHQAFQTKRELNTHILTHKLWPGCNEVDTEVYPPRPPPPTVARSLKDRCLDVVVSVLECFF